MKAWEWECLEGWVSNQTFKITDCGPLYGPVSNFSITRDADLKLVLETTSEESSKTSLSPIPAGTVFYATDQVRFESRFGTTAVAQGVIPFSLKSSYGAHRNEKREISSVHAFEWSAETDKEPQYLIEWFENMSGSFIWPHSVDEKSTGTAQLIFRSPETEIVFSSPIDSGGGSRTCVHISVEGVDLFVGASENIKVENICHPGFILYKGNPSEEVRGKIRDCVSFSLGMYLIYLGYTCFDKDFSPVSFKAVSAYALSKDDNRLHAIPPAPLGLKYEWEITAALLEKMVSSLCLNYEKYNFRSVFWAYWHAIAAPIHMSAVHFGAAIESLQSAFLKNSSIPIDNFILDNASWGKLSEKMEELESIVSTLEVPQKGKEILTNKLKKLNIAPQDVVMSRVLEVLKIQIDVIEKSAWKNRNRAAHGGSVDEENAIKIIRENKALRVLMNRILLAIVSGSDFYYDYYTLGRPISRLAAPIPND